MAALAFLVLILAMTGHASGSWCVCKNGISETVLQKTLDYACGAGADCNPIHSSGVCYGPNTVLAHCNYAVNSYYQRKGQVTGSCDFAGAATVTGSDPSTTGCAYPTSASFNAFSSSILSSPTSATNTGTVPVTTTPSSTTTGTTTTTNPYSTTNPNGVLGGIGTGMGPSGTNMDESAGFIKPASAGLTLIFSGLVMLLWG